MGILEFAKPVLVVCVCDRAAAVEFYRDKLGLRMTGEDRFASVFDVGGNALRVSTVEGFVPHEHTVMGFKVPDVAATVSALRDAGVAFSIHPGFNQDALGIWTAPDGGIQVAWFKDPDGNVLSVTNA